MAETAPLAEFQSGLVVGLVPRLPVTPYGMGKMQFIKKISFHLYFWVTNTYAHIMWGLIL